MGTGLTRPGRASVWAPHCKTAAWVSLGLSSNLSHGHFPSPNTDMCNFYRNWPENRQLPKCISCSKVLMVLLTRGKPSKSRPARSTACVLLTVYGLTFDPKSLCPCGQRLVTLDLYFHFKRPNSKASLHTCGLWQGNSCQAAEGKSLWLRYVM